MAIGQGVMAGAVVAKEVAEPMKLSVGLGLDSWAVKAGTPIAVTGAIRIVEVLDAFVVAAGAVVVEHIQSRRA